MKKLKPFSQLEKDVNSGDLIRLRLESESEIESIRANTFASGYRWENGFICLTSGRGCNKNSTFARRQGTDISKGYYLDSKILGYEVIRRYKK